MLIAGGPTAFAARDARGADEEEPARFVARALDVCHPLLAAISLRHPLPDRHPAPANVRLLQYLRISPHQDALVRRLGCVDAEEDAPVPFEVARPVRAGPWHEVEASVR